MRATPTWMTHFWSPRRAPFEGPNGGWACGQPGFWTGQLHLWLNLGPRWVAHSEPARPWPASPVRTSRTPWELLCRQGAPPKPKLSAEEARKQAEDMVRKAKERREARSRREPYHNPATVTYPGPLLELPWCARPRSAARRAPAGDPAITLPP